MAEEVTFPDDITLLKAYSLANNGKQLSKAERQTFLEHARIALSAAPEKAPPQPDRVAELEHELETERMRLAACGTAALGYYNGCADEYRSASLDDVLRIRAEVERLRGELGYVRDYVDSLVENSEVAHAEGLLRDIDGFLAGEGAVMSFRKKGPYTAGIDSSGHNYVDGPGEGLSYYSGTLYPNLLCETEKEAQRAAVIANIAFDEGMKAARRQMRKSLGIES